MKSDNLVAAALLSKMGYKQEEKIEVKKEFLRMLVRMELDPVRARFINGFFEKYLILNEEEEEVLMEEISQLDNAHEFTKLPNSWEERGIRKGIEKGREEVVFGMLKEGLSIDLIAKITDLDKAAIEELQKKVIK